MRWLWPALGVLLLTLVTQAVGHEFRPGFLRIQQVSPNTYDMLWRVPARGNLRLALDIHLPDSCTTLGDRLRAHQGTAFVDRWTVTCSGGLAGNILAVDGLSSVATDVLVRYERLDATTQVGRLTPWQDSLTISNAASASAVAAAYFRLGLEHILLGIDHLLFVLTLLMIVSGWRKLVATITAFTMAHSVTLAAATQGWVHVPQSPVEAVIALSILFVTTEIIRWRQGDEPLTRRRPWLVAFLFGLLHGFGFAGALAEIGLPEHAIPLALLFFNLGVEAGQLCFVAVMLIAIKHLLVRVPWPLWAWRLPVYGIGTIAAYWTISRIAAF
ncbi:MAG: hypothetical protein DIZ78_11375 [endosymbiont of Escarpia spicata]|uniref:HupE/UreJ family protein n=1 Tax=endosymbiont of Escarpia spicata TaxID=2200908 RepID=A0A370DKV7_9GAMM|nr:MAG: hypothetical protein DIZ78_11375 [endosymbiont of Escarpia spicata]